MPEERQIRGYVGLRPPTWRTTMMAKAKKRVLTPEEQTKAIVVEFADGPMDGRVLRSDSDDRVEVERALDAYLVHSDGGTIGARYRAKSEADVEETGHVYEVVDRHEDEATIRVRFQYMGTDE
jgi:hypothetical protein